MKKLFLFLCVVFAAACSDRAVGPERSDDDAIHTAFFAEIIDAEPSEAASAYCISTGSWNDRQDPTTDVLNDLRGLFGKIQPASACVAAGNEFTYGGEPARAYHIDSVTRTGNTATVTGFFYQSATHGAAYQAQLEKQGTFWVVMEMTRLDELHATS